MKEELDLIDYIEILVRRVGLISAITVFVIVIALLYVTIAPKTYTSESVIQLGKINTDIYTAPETKNIIESSSVLIPVIEKHYNSSITVQDFKGLLKVDIITEEITVTNIKETPLLRIKTKANTPEKAQEINQEIITQFFNYIQPEYEARINLRLNEIIQRQEIIQDDLNQIATLNLQIPYSSGSDLIVLKSLISEYNAQAADQQNRILEIQKQLTEKREYKTLSEPQIPQTYSSPQKTRDLILAAIVGLIIAILVSITLESYKNKRW